MERTGVTDLSIVALAPAHAAAAARLHIESQPGAFLPSLGPEVLAALYRALPATAVGFGFVAVAPMEHPPAPPVVGFVSATTSVGRLFAEVGWRLLPPLLARLARRPSLIGRSLQTLLYPLLARDAHEQAASPVEGGSAELLSIMVEPAWRSRRIGSQLLDALVAACRARAVTRLDVTVDAANQGAQRFYTRHGFAPHRSFVLYGREMAQYRRFISPTPPVL